MEQFGGNLSLLSVEIQCRKEIEKANLSKELAQIRYFVLVDTLRAHQL